MKYTILFLVLFVTLYSSYAMSFNAYKEKYSSITDGQLTLSEQTLQQMYDEFLTTFKATEANIVGDYAKRFSIFKDNLKTIITHNQASGKSWKMGINEYTDMTDDEFFTHFRLNTKAPQECSATASPQSVFASNIPASFDWRNHGKVTPVKNQGSCGSCWTFSTVGAMESHALISSGRVSGANFSEQQLVDCAGAFDCHGCAGGLPSYAFTYINYAGGMTTEQEYPYTATDGTCYFNRTSMAKVHTSGSFNITAQNETQLIEAIAEHGPVSVAFQVVDDLRHYSSGVYNSTNCNNTSQDVNHAVLAVGYGHNSTQKLDFLSIKNSWGASWGNNGYFDIQRGVNMCGIGVCNSYPLNVTWTSNSIESFLREI